MMIKSKDIQIFIFKWWKNNFANSNIFHINFNFLKEEKN